MVAEDMERMTGFASLARGMGAADDELTRLQLAVEAAVDLIDRCSLACITVNDGGECVTLASSDEIVQIANKLQNELSEGPCHDPARSEEVVVSTDLLRDERWARWGPRVHAELRAQSVLSVLIFSGERSYGTLSVYAVGTGSFTADDLAILAGHLAVALTASREIDGLGVALHSRTVIGQAEGMLMERLGIDAEQALAYLKRISSHENKKLVHVATELVRTRELPS